MQQKQLRESETSLADRFDLGVVADASSLRESALTLAAAGWFGWVRSDVRAAQRQFRALSRQRFRLRNTEMAAGFRALAEFVERRTALETHPALSKIAGVHTAGAATPLAAIQSVTHWFWDLEVTLRGLVPSGHEVLRGVQELDDIALVALADRSRGYQAAAALEQTLETARSLLGWDGNGAAELGDVMEHVSNLREEIGEATDRLRELGLPFDWTRLDLEQYEEKVERLAAIGERVQQNKMAAEALGDLWDGLETDVDTVGQTLTYAEQLASAELPERMLSSVFSEDADRKLAAIHRQGEDVGSRLSDFREAIAELVALTSADLSRWVADDDGGVDGLELNAFIQRCDRAVETEQGFQQWIEFTSARANFKTETAAQIADLAVEGRLNGTSLQDAFEFVLFESMSRSVFSEEPELVQFQGRDHGRLREEFQRTDREVIELYRKRIAADLDNRNVPLGNGVGPVRSFSELALIEHEISKQRKHIPIRKLVRRAGKALQALKPCFMMGPLSVAQYLPLGSLDFDLVVMDEASQLKPEDALGSVARGSQLVVVGDSKQLPPTSFFDRLDELDEDEEETAEGVLEAESILDVAASAYRPTRALRWHYRSRHASLIAFSNRQFYNDNLVIFPSPIVQSPDLGVKFHFVHGRYESRRNVPEAATVVDFVLRFMGRRSAESLGVVTLNTTQRNVIQEEFEQRLKRDPFAQTFLDKWEDGLEPFFIKNLENVQGDERDVIIISVAYGPDAHGRIYQRFGPVNGPTGHRRLNVLFTRARNRVEVFSSMRSADIRADSGSAPGLIALKNYLAYAETGRLEQAQFTGREPDSDFEVEVAEALQARGFEVVAQVGVAGYFIDLAVRHPQHPGLFILGIECDGATYHSAKSARDRDRLRQEVLEDKNWTIHRIWSTDWFRDPVEQTDRVVELVEQLMVTGPVLAPGEVLEGESEDALDLSFAPDSAEDSVIVHDQREQEIADRVTKEEAREDLVTFRDEVLVQTFREIPDEQSILRPEMLHVLLRELPASREEWLRKVPLELRLETAPEHMVVLDDILAVLKRVVR